jgi:hypothetical protein
VGACVTLSACANILGLEDRVVGDGDAAVSASTTAATSQSSSGTTSGVTSASASTGTTTGGAMDAGIEDASRDAPEKGRNDATVDDGGDAEVPEASSACPATGPCVLASGLNHPWTIAVDELRVYWTEAGTDSTTTDGSVKSCPLAGCGAGPTVYASNLSFPRDIAVDSTFVYWESMSSSTSGGIWRCPLAGCVGAPTQLATATQPYGMALDATYVYWVDQFDNSVHRTPKAGGGTNQVLDDGGSSVHTIPQRAAVDNAFVYFGDDFGNTVSVPFDGGAPRVLQTNDGTNTEYAILVDSTSIYYGATNFNLSANYPNSDFFFRTDKKTSNATQVPLVPNVDWAYALALDSDAGQLYFGDFGDDFSPTGALGRVGIDGGGLTYFGQNLAPIEWVGVNSTYLAYATYANDFNWNSNSGSIIRTAK